MASDEQLLKRWGDGERQAGNELVERHFRSVYGFFRNKVGSEIDDLIQRTFLACAEGRDRFRGDASFRTFLFAIARNQLLVHYRDARRARGVESDQLSVADLSPSPSEVVAQASEQRLLLRALRQLPLDDQVALELSYWEGMASADIGQVLGLTDGSARSRLRRARERLAAQLAALADSPALLRSTTDDLERWAASLREMVGRERPDALS